ncbi:hypothetical protein JCM10213_004334 [Rhodosporidiobolus nylandii]
MVSQDPFTLLVQQVREIGQDVADLEGEVADLKGEVADLKGKVAKLWQEKVGYADSMPASYRVSGCCCKENLLKIPTAGGDSELECFTKELSKHEDPLRTGIGDLIRSYDAQQPRAKGSRKKANQQLEDKVEYKIQSFHYFFKSFFASNVVTAYNNAKKLKDEASKARTNHAHPRSQPEDHEDAIKEATKELAEVTLSKATTLKDDILKYLRPPPQLMPDEH